MKRSAEYILLALCTSIGAVTVTTSSGVLTGTDSNGVSAFKGIPFAVPPVNSLRWTTPKAFTSTAAINATTLSPSCVQQIAFASANLTNSVFNNPPPASESEDCLFLNVWAPSDFSSRKPVVVWFYGGSLAFGTASIPQYDGTSIAKNQDIIIVTINYRTNVFGFPGAEEFFPLGENLGFLDQELSLRWVQQNIANFGGDPAKVTIMGQSAGGESVESALQANPVNPPFRAAIVQSGAVPSIESTPNFTVFDTFARAVGCDQAPGDTRLACLRAVPTSTISAWINGPQGLSFAPIVDNTTLFNNPLERIRAGQTAHVPLLIGANQDDGSFFALAEGSPTIEELVASLEGSSSAVSVGLSVALIRSLYPGLNDTELVARVIRDFVFLCPSELTATAYEGPSGLNVFRYIYGAVFQDQQVFPNAGAFHAAEIPEIFGTFNPSTATDAEKTFSATMQTIWANFIKDPTQSPAPNWPKYIPLPGTNTLANIGFEVGQGKVNLSNAVQAAPSKQQDTPCDLLWDLILDPIV